MRHFMGQGPGEQIHRDTEGSLVDTMKHMHIMGVVSHAVILKQNRKQFYHNYCSDALSFHFVCVGINGGAVE